MVAHDIYKLVLLALLLTVVGSGASSLKPMKQENTRPTDSHDQMVPTEVKSDSSSTEQNITVHSGYSKKVSANGKEDANDLPDITANLIEDDTTGNSQSTTPMSDEALTTNPTMTDGDALNTENSEILNTVTPILKQESIETKSAGLFDREKLISALTESFSSIIPKVEGISSTDFKPQPILDLSGKNIHSSGLSGNEPKSGPSPDSFGPIDDIFPVVFPRPASSGRESFIPHSSSFDHFSSDPDNEIHSHHHPASSGKDNFSPLPPSLERGHVSRHFSEKDSINSKAFIDTHLSIDEESIHNRFETENRPHDHTVRNRTPKPGKRPMLMMLNPSPLDREGKNIEFVPRRGHHDFSLQSFIGIEPKGDYGQIKRILPRHDEHHSSHPHTSQRHSFNRPIGLFPSNSQHHFSGIDPILFDSNLVVEEDRSPPHRRFSDNHFSPSLPPIILSTIGPPGLHLGDGFLNYDESQLHFAPRQLPEFGQDPTIFHRGQPGQPTLFPVHGNFNDGPFGLGVNIDRRPLTRNTYLNPGGNHFSTFVTPREPNNKLPFGIGLLDSNLVTGKPTIFSHSSTIRPPTNAHGVPLHSLDYDNSHFLRPMSARPTTIRDSSNPSPFFHFTGSTPGPIFHNSITPIPDHNNHHHHVSILSSPSPSISYHTTPRPTSVIHVTSPSPTYSDHYLPRGSTHSPPSFIGSTFGPSVRPFLSTTSRPILSTTRRTRHSSNRGSSRYTPPSSHYGPRPVRTKFEVIPADASHTDYSSQYHSGEHLSHDNSQYGGRPWVSHDDLPDGEHDDSDEKEYTYHYTVHSPSTGDIKNVHETRLSDGGVVGGYSFLQPDGLTRQVSYTADKLNGFRANVEYLPPRPELRG